MEQQPEQDFKLKNVTWRLHEQRGRIHENVELRRKYLEQARALQLHSEKNDIRSHIGKLQEGPRKLFLKLRLQKIQEHLKKK